MKIFVYDKHTSKRLNVIDDVTKVEEHKRTHTIVFHSASLGKVEYDTKCVKTSSFQN